MTTVKVECSCGQRFAFEVEPIHGRMPAPVACPTCGADGTAAANAILAQTFDSQLAQPAVALPPPVPVRARLAVAAPVAASVPVAAPAVSAPGRPVQAAVPARRPIPPPPSRGKDGWSSDETSFNKLGTYIVMIPSIVAAMLTWGIFGVQVPIPILCTIVGVCGLAGGVINILGRGPIWAGALIGLMMGLGGYGAVSWWIQGRPSVYKFEMAIAFVIGAAPGFGLQFALQQILRKRDNPV